MMIRATLTTAFLLAIASGTTAHAQAVQTLFSDGPYALAQAVRTPDDYEPYPLAQITNEMRYPAAEPPVGTVNRHGEVEYLGHNVFGLHWYIEANDAVWHFVTAGDPGNEAIRLVHGHPDTWWSWHEVMALLADDFYVIAVDTLGYGQSDKRLELDLTYAGVAALGP